MLPLAQRRMRAAEGEHGAVVRRAPSRGSSTCRSTALVRWSAGTGSQARVAVVKPPMRRLRLPDHRRAAAVAALELRPELDAVGIDQILEGELGLGQAQLLALVEADRAAHRQQQRAGEPREGLLLAVRGPAADVADDVVVGEGEADPAVGRVLLGGRRCDLRKCAALNSPPR